MSMFIRDAQADRGCDTVGCQGCPFQAIDDDMLGCELEKGSSYLGFGADLWSLVDEERGRKIDRWFSDEWSVAEGEEYEDYDVRVYSPASCRYLLTFLPGIDDALIQAGITDNSWHTDAATAAQISARYPWLVDSWEGESGRVYTLGNRVIEVGLVIFLMKKAIALDRDIMVG